MRCRKITTAGRLVTFKCDTVDFRTQPAKRLYRYAVVPGRVETPPAKMDARTGNEPTRTTQFEWLAPTKEGDYTFFAQEIDRDLNYSMSKARGPSDDRAAVVFECLDHGCLRVALFPRFVGLGICRAHALCPQAPRSRAATRAVA